MKCQQIEILLCDYVEGSLDQAGRQAVESHLPHCPSCAELARDSAAALAFLENIDAVEPPAELITSILFRSPAGVEPVTVPSRSQGILAWLKGIFQPVLQPKFAMGMAMTILSFSMIGRLAGIEQRPLTAADLNPVKIWSETDVKVQRAWDRAVKYYENLRLVYEIQNRLQEWSAQEEQARADEERKSRRAIDPVVTTNPVVVPRERKNQP